MAQDSEGKINGTVKDPDGAVVAGANVSLLHSHRAVIAATTTDAEGRFTLEHVSPGDYQLNVEGPGFVRYRSAVHVTAGGTQDVAVVLEVTAHRGTSHDHSRSRARYRHSQSRHQSM